LAALALKTFSLNAVTKKTYRYLGNKFGSRMRLAVDDIDIRVSRGDLLVELCETHGAVRDGDRVLEIGTGWMHWYSLYLRLFYEVRVTALDIWDNRQFEALRAASRKLTAILQARALTERVRSNLSKINDSNDFAELYARLGYEYLIEPTGSLAGFGDNQFDMIMSFHVLEHVPAQHVDTLVTSMFRTLRPGGLTIHQIGIDDHLAHYDRRASEKQYLQYSDRTWRTFFENDVQYFNRLQPSDWIAAFERTGFRLKERKAAGTQIDSLRIHPRFMHYPRADLACTTLTLVYQKPAAGQFPAPP
jgi:SAM-dependent methyltransferase